MAELLKTTALTGFILIALALPARAERISDAWCNDEAQDSWHFYCDPEPIPEPEVMEEPEPMAQPKLLPTPEEMEDTIVTARDRLQVFADAVEESKALAIIEPTIENLVAYMEIQKVMIDRAENFQKTWALALYENPELDHNNVYPLTNPGAFDYQDRQRLEREAKIAVISETHVIMFVTERPDICYVCKTQSGIVRELIEQHAVSVFVVSKDGYRYEEFPDAEIDRGNLESIGLGDNPTPFFAIIDPATGDVNQIGHGLLTRDQILARVLEVMEPKTFDLADTIEEELPNETP